MSNHIGGVFAGPGCGFLFSLPAAGTKTRKALDMADASETARRVLSRRLGFAVHDLRSVARTLTDPGADRSDVAGRLAAIVRDLRAILLAWRAYVAPPGPNQTAVDLAEKLDPGPIVIRKESQDVYE